MYTSGVHLCIFSGSSSISSSTLVSTYGSIIDELNILKIISSNTWKQINFDSPNIFKKCCGKKLLYLTFVLLINLNPSGKLYGSLFAFLSNNKFMTGFIFFLI